MPVQFSAANIVYDLLNQFSVVSGHPSQQNIILGDEFFATCVTSQNWKPFIVGIIAPDNPIDFVPVTRLMQEIKKAEMPPTLQKPAAKKTKAKGDDKKGSVIVPMQNKPVTVDEQRAALLAAWTRKNGGVPPSDELLALMCAQMWTESGGVHRDGNGQMQVQPVFHPPNYNSFGYHDVAVKPPTYRAQRVGGPGQELNKWVDDKGNEWGPNGEQLTNDGTIGIMRGGQMYFAPKDGHSTMGFASGTGSAESFYAAINRPGSRFLGTDTEGGGVYISSYKAFNTFDDAATEFVSYIYDTFPDVRSASTPEEYEHAIMNGLVQNGITRKFHDPSAKVRKDYISGLTNGLQAYNNRYGNEQESLSGQGRSADATDDPSQHVMAYGASFDLDDPLASVFGRNIAADETRLSMIQSQMNALSMQLSILRSIPPLILLVNPQEFRRSHENLVDAGTKTRVGNIVHTWLEQPVKINASGVSAAQFAVAADMSGGLTTYNRVHSLSYRNLMSLVMIYKNNGSLYDVASGASEDGSVGSAAGDGSIILPGSVFIYYDDHVYIGSFDSFGITDDAGKPHNLAYTFTFTVRYDIHVDMGIDAQLSATTRG